MVFWKKGNERFALVIVAVVAVFGLFLMWQNAGDGDVTGFAAKKAMKKAPAVQAAAKSSSGGAGAPGCAAGWSKTSGRQCNSPPRQNQILAKYTCKSDASKTSWRLERTCTADQRCQNGACIDAPVEVVPEQPAPPQEDAPVAQPPVVSNCTDTDNSWYSNSFHFDSARVVGTTRGVTPYSYFINGRQWQQGETAEMTDYCSDSQNLTEGYCGNNGFRLEGLNCASRGGEGMVCQNGACVNP